MIKDFLFLDRHIPGIENEFVFHIGSFHISNSLIFSLLILLIILILSLSLKRKSLIPNKARAFIEIVYEAIYNQIKSTTITDKHTNRVFAIIASIFLYIGLSNYLALIPGISSFTYNGHHLFRVPTSDFNVTLGLAFGALVVIQAVNLYDNGLWNYFQKFVPVQQIKHNMKDGFGMGIFNSIITILITLLELIGEITKTLSVSLRLFGNLYAGEVLTFVLLGIFSIGLPAVWTGIALLVAIVQTIVFGSLITVFYMQAVSHHGHETEGAL
jgi:F-type H+-transporting ATPase subunit a